MFLWHWKTRLKSFYWYVGKNMYQFSQNNAKIHSTCNIWCLPWQKEINTQILSYAFFIVEKDNDLFWTMLMVFFRLFFPKNSPINRWERKHIENVPYSKLNKKNNRHVDTVRCLFHQEFYGSKNAGVKHEVEGQMMVRWLQIFFFVSAKTWAQWTSR